MKPARLLAGVVRRRAALVVDLYFLVVGRASRFGREGSRRDSSSHIYVRTQTLTNDCRYKQMFAWAHSLSASRVRETPVSLEALVSCIFSVNSFQGIFVRVFLDDVLHHSRSVA